MERFWSKVDKSGDCWEWTAYTVPNGYGLFYFNGKQRYAHRVAYELTKGPIPEGLQVHHLCGNKACVNPSHLKVTAPQEELFWDKVDKSGDCWEWTACKSHDGYGTFAINRKMHYAMRVAYELIKGPIPEGLELDHICRNRACVNPYHLEPVTHKENCRRGTGRGGVLHNPITHCVHGHPRTPENVSSDGHCKVCRRDQAKERYWEAQSKEAEL